MRPTSGKLIWVRAALLGVSLLAVVFVIRNTNQGAIEKAFLSLGIEPGTGQSPGLQPGSRPLQPGESRWTICTNRIRRIEWFAGDGIEEQKEGLKMRWLAYVYDPKVGARGPGAPRSRELQLDYMDMEKWLSRNCQVIISELKSQDPAGLSPDPGAAEMAAEAKLRYGSLTPLLRVEFIDGSQVELSRHSELTNLFYRVATDAKPGLHFMSPYLSAGLLELRSLATLPPN
jgi:hypothetical protein